MAVQGLFGIPSMKVASMKEAWTEHYGAGNFVTRIPKTEKKDYEKYLKSLTKAGFVKYVDNGSEGLGNTVFTTTFTRGNAVLTVTYMSLTKETCVILAYDMPLSPNLFYNDEYIADNKEGAQTKIHMPELFSFGNSILFQLKNGHFIISDGGMWADLPYLLDYMESLVPEGEKPVVDAWFITHAHSDHSGAIEEAWFTKSYVSRFYVEGVYFNEPDDRYTNKHEPPKINIARIKMAARNLLTTEGGHPNIYRPYTGQRFYFNDITIEVMFGQEQGLFANYGHDVNDTSTVTMVNIEGQKCLMTGDIDISGLTFMMENYHSEYFDVDYMTLSHHGFNTRNEFTDFCKVKTLFMPSKCILPVRKVRENAYLRSKTEESFFWGDGTKIMTFPYKVGTYESLPCKTEWIYHLDDVRPTKGGTMYTFPGRKVNTFIFNAEGFLYVDGKLREGMTDVLDYVKERGGRMLVISDKSKDETIADLQTLGIDTYFEEVLGRDMIENVKPATDMMDLVLEKYPQEDIHRYLILTHDINDVYVANTLGLRCIIVPVDGQVDEIMDDRSWKALEKIEDIIPYFDWRKLRVE